MIRLYGTSKGQGSFARVTQGMRHALTDLEVLAGFVPVDVYNTEDVYPGHDAEIGVYVGDPRAAAMMTGIGWHKHRLLLLPANSSYVPPAMIERLEKVVTGFLAPSRWAADVLQRYTKFPVEVWRHGVSDEFVPVEDRQKMMKRFENGQFHVAHFASTPLERKGTRTLLQAWKRAQIPGGRLNMFVDCVEGYFGEDGKDASILWYPRQNLSVSQAAIAYGLFHLIAQPSRGEGFGLVPLEARACGVPVLATMCTGHSEHLNEVSPGVVFVKTGPDTSIDDGPGAMAPSLDVDDVAFALKTAHQTWPFMKDTCSLYAPVLNKIWSWTNVTKIWLEDYEHG